jgi:hypothetical protein
MPRMLSARVLLLHGICLLRRLCWCCNLVLFRHIQKTGGISIRTLFLQLAEERDGSSQGGSGWRTAAPYMGHCVGSQAFRRSAFDQWLADRQKGSVVDAASPNIFLEYHVGYDHAEQFYKDLAVARAAQTARCRVLAVGIVRRPEAWIRSMFKHDVKRYRGQANGPQPPAHRPEFAIDMCKFVVNIWKLWGAVATWHGDGSSGAHARAHVRIFLRPVAQRLNVSFWTDDETTNHTDSQSNALMWRVQQAWSRRPPPAEAYALSVGEGTVYDILGITERLDLVIEEIFQRTGHATRPTLVHENSISTTALRIKNLSDANCSRLVAALDGAPDPIFDGFANRSVRDRALWRDAAHHAAALANMRPLLPVRPLAEPTYRWDLVQVPHNASWWAWLPPPAAAALAGASAADGAAHALTTLRGVPGWAAYRLLSDHRKNVSLLCLRRRVS